MNDRFSRTILLESLYAASRNGVRGLFEIILYMPRPHESSGGGSVTIDTEDTAMANDYVTRGEFKDFTQRTK